MFSIKYSISKFHYAHNRKFNFLVREKKSKETAAEKNIKNSKSSNDPDKDSSDNNPNSNDLITSTIEETECDWEFAHVIYLLKLILYERIYNSYSQSNTIEYIQIDFFYLSGGTKGKNRY